MPVCKLFRQIVIRLEAIKWLDIEGRYADCAAAKVQSYF